MNDLPVTDLDRRDTNLTQSKKNSIIIDGLLLGVFANFVPQLILNQSFLFPMSAILMMVSVGVFMDSFVPRNVGSKFGKKIGT